MSTVNTKSTTLKLVTIASSSRSGVNHLKKASVSDVGAIQRLLNLLQGTSSDLLVGSSSQLVPLDPPAAPASDGEYPDFAAFLEEVGGSVDSRDFSSFIEIAAGSLCLAVLWACAVSCSPLEALFGLHGGSGCGC